MMMSTIQAARSLEISTNTMREWALKKFLCLGCMVDILAIYRKV